MSADRGKDSTLDKRPSAQGLASLVTPTLDEASVRLHGVVENLRASAEGVVDHAGAESRRALQEAEERGGRFAAHARREAQALLNDADERLARQQQALAETGEKLLEQWKNANEELAASVMDKVLAVALAVVIAYGAYVPHAVPGQGMVDLLGMARLFWVGMTLLSLGLGLAWALAGRGPRLRGILILELYVLCLASLAGGVLYVMGQLR